MATRKIVATLLVFIVILVVAPINNAQDQDKCYADCEKTCVDEGNARSFCMLKCEKECVKGRPARRLMKGLEPQTTRRLMQLDVDANSKATISQPDQPDSAKEQETARSSV